MEHIFVGIDPGLKGGIAIHNNGTVTAIMMPLAGNAIDFHAIATHLVDECGGMSIIHVYIEKVRSMPKQGVASMFKFGMGYGGLLGVCAALSMYEDIRVQTVTPQQWKRRVLAGTKKDKAAAIAFCNKKWPRVNLIPKGKRVPQDGIADALCIMEHGRLQHVRET